MSRTDHRAPSAQNGGSASSGEQEGPGRHLILAVYVLVAIFAPLIAPYAPHGRSFVPLLRRQPITGWAPTTGGQDIFSQLIYGTRVSLLVGLLRRAAGYSDRAGGRHGLRLRRGHDRRRHPVLLHQRRAGHPGAAADHRAGRLLRGPRHRADRRRHRASPRGPARHGPSGRRSSRCATATSSPRRSSPARARCGSCSARSCRT